MVLDRISRWRQRRRDEDKRRILAVLLLHDRLRLEPHLSGFPLMQATRMGSGQVYVTLARLENAGTVTSEWEVLPPGTQRPRRRLYRLTEAGREHATRVVTDWLHATRQQV